MFLLGSNNDNQIDGLERLQEFINKWELKYPTLKNYRKQRNIYYFTYTQFPDSSTDDLFNKLDWTTQSQLQTSFKNARCNA